MSKRKRNPMGSLMEAAASAKAEEQQPRAERRNQLSGLQLIEDAYNTIREIDPDLIDDSSIADRLELFTTVKSDTNPKQSGLKAEDELDQGSLERLVDSIRTHGQKVPILLRQKQDSSGRYEIVYGRRRLAAIRFIRANPAEGSETGEQNLSILANIAVKADGQTDEEFDREALETQALENAARKDLSIYEQARFAKAIVATGRTKTEVAAIMNMGATNLSNLLKITRLIPDKIGDSIGAAPKCGRPKWEALANALDANTISAAKAEKLLSDCEDKLSSDERLELLLSHVKAKKKTKQEKPNIRKVSSVATVAKAKDGLTLTIKDTQQTKGFSDWLNDNMDEMIERSLNKFMEESRVRD